MVATNIADAEQKTEEYKQEQMASMYKIIDTFVHGVEEEVRPKLQVFLLDEFNIDVDKICEEK